MSVKRKTHEVSPTLALQGQGVDQDLGLIGIISDFTSCRNLLDVAKHSKLFKQDSNARGREPVRVFGFINCKLEL